MPGLNINTLEEASIVGLKSVGKNGIIILELLDGTCFKVSIPHFDMGSKIINKKNDTADRENSFKKLKNRAFLLKQKAHKKRHLVSKPKLMATGEIQSEAIVFDEEEKLVEQLLILNSSQASFILATSHATNNVYSVHFEQNLRTQTAGYHKVLDISLPDAKYHLGHSH